MAQVLSPGEVPELHLPTQKQEEWQENLNVRLLCSNCHIDPPDIVDNHSSGDLTCGNCGFVMMGGVIDQSSEWRTFSNDDQGNDDPSRVGEADNPLLNGEQLNTSIAFSDGGMRSRELHRAQNRANLDKGNKSLLQAYKHIGALAQGWELSNTVVDTAKHLYKDADESRIFKGKSQDALIAGCLFLACRRNNVPRSFREVTDLTKVSKKEIGRTFKMLEKFLLNRDKERKNARIIAGGVVVSQDQYKGSGTANPADLCNRYCNMLGIDTPIAIVAAALATNSNSTGSLAGRSPLSTAAACIFMATHIMNQPRTAKEIQAVAGVSDSTIRHAYKLLYGDKEKILTPEIVAKGADPAKLPKPS